MVSGDRTGTIHLPPAPAPPEAQALGFDAECNEKGSVEKPVDMRVERWNPTALQLTQKF